MSIPAPVEPLKLVGIVTKQSGVFICAASTNTSGYWRRTELGGYVFDGKKAALVPTRVDSWFKIDAVPSKVQRIIPPQRTILGYKLLAGFVASEKLPAYIKGSSLSDTIWEGVSECYECEMETSAETYEDTPFQLHVIAERDKFEVIKSDFNLQYGLIDQLTVDPILLQERPCRLDATASYKIIREHVQRNIDPKWAVITSDYDFCFSVEKRIPLAAPIPFQKTVKISARRSKEVTDYRHCRTVKIYETSPPDRNGKPYSSYPLTAPFVGSCYEDLQATIKTFLNNLMDKINEPIKDCPHCGGKGVIVEPITKAT